MELTSTTPLCPTKFDNNNLSLLPIDEILADLKAYESRESSTPREEEKKALEKLYSKIRTVDESTSSIDALSKTFHHYACAIFSDNYAESKLFSLAAIERALFAEHHETSALSYRWFATLQDLRSHFKENPGYFDALEEKVKKWSPTFASTLLEKAAKESKVFFASLLRQLAGCLQNIDSYITGPYKEPDLLETLFYNAENLLLPIQDLTQAKTLLAELYYNIYPDVVEKKSPDDIDKVVAAYDKALELDTSLSMKARVANICACQIRGTKPVEEVLKYLDQALGYQKQIPDFNPFVQANMHNSRACMELQRTKPDLDVALTYIAVALEHSKAKRAIQEDHLYFATYDQNAAKIYILIGDIEKAELFAKKAQETIDKYPESNRDDIEKQSKLLAAIDDLKKKKP